MCNHPLGHHTTIGVGGPARYFAVVSSPEQLLYAVRWAHEREVPVFVLGGGSNVLISDEGFPGLVVHIGLRGWQVVEEGDYVLLAVASGERWDYVVELAVSRHWAGIECLSGIPGQVGATPIQNVGAYGQQVSETIAEVKAIDLQSGETVVIPGSECEFGYRTSRFRTRDAGRFFITHVTFKLVPGGPPTVRYPELAAYLKEQNISNPDPAQVRGAVRAIRARKSMLVDPNDPNSRSCGSFFVNPVVSQEQFNELVAIVRRKGLVGRDELPPHYGGKEGIKLSAAWLIESAGFRRGTRLGPAALSQKHALAIVNMGGAKARDIIALADLIRLRVFEQFGLVLEPEPVFVGFEKSPLTPLP